MDGVFLSRLQFGITIGFHYIFPQLTIGLAWINFWIMTRYLRTGDQMYKAMARFWIRVFALGFAVGVGTGIVMEFQFGANWAAYSRFVGDIFGAPLAAEAVLAFFLESTFLGLLLFGEKRLSVKWHWFSSLMVAVGATLSAFWIIVANSWQQTPAGYDIVNGRAVLTDFFDAVFNPSTLVRYLHAVDGTLVAGAFFVMGISAYYLLKGRHEEFARRSFKIGLILAFFASVMQINFGHLHAVQVTETQPEKLAAFEGLFDSEKGAPLLLFGIPNYEKERTDYAIKIPGLLSLMAKFDKNAEVKGLKAFPKDEWPPLMPTFWSFHIMVGLGFFFVALTGAGVLLLLMKKIFSGQLYAQAFLILALLATPLPIIANELGWIAAEMGRQPWVVYKLMKTSEAISISVPPWQVLASLIMFCLIYTILFFIWISLLWRKINQGPEEAPETPQEAVS